jgi:hypothetical protein
MRIQIEVIKKDINLHDYQTGYRPLVEGLGAPGAFPVSANYTYLSGGIRYSPKKRGVPYPDSLMIICKG